MSSGQAGQAFVIYFDIPATNKERCFSLNMWRIRYLLNYKKIAHTTRWLEYPAIKPLFLEMGIPPTAKNADGGDHFTCPSIQYFPADGSAPILVTDSWKIAAFLEERHPSPTVFPKLPKASLQEQTDYSNQLWDEFLPPLFPALIRGSCLALNEASQPYFRETREKILGMKLEEMSPTKEAVNDALATSKGHLDKFMKNFPGDGPFLYGEEVTYLDMILTSIFSWMKCISEDELWAGAKEWDGGRWKRVLEIFEERGYSVVHE